MTCPKEFPDPDEISFLLMERENGAPIPVDRLPEREWLRLRGQILRSVGRSFSDMAARGRTPPSREP